MEHPQAHFVQRASALAKAVIMLVQRANQGMGDCTSTPIPVIADERMVGSEQDADDIVQETFLRAYRQIAKFESRANFGTWLYRIAINCSLDHLRGRLRHPHEQPPEDDPPDPEPAPDASPERLLLSAEVQATVSGALRELSDAERAAFLLRHFEGQSIAEIGRILGLQTSATKHTVFRAVQKMRRALEPFVEHGVPRDRH